MRSVTRTMLVAGLLALCGPLQVWAKDGEKEQKIELEKVPDNVKKAAQEAVKGIVLTGAEKGAHPNMLVYELEGTADGKKYEIEVSAGGRVLKVEQEDDKDNKNDNKEGKEAQGEKKPNNGRAND